MAVDMEAATTTTTTTTMTLGSWLTSEQLGVGSQPAWLYSALLVAVIAGGMRTTRRGMLALLAAC